MKTTADAQVQEKQTMPKAAMSRQTKAASRLQYGASLAPSRAKFHVSLTPEPVKWSVLP